MAREAAVRYVPGMTTVSIIIIALGVLVSVAAVAAALLARRRGGFPVYSRRWYQITIMSGVGGGFIAIGILTLIL